MSTLTEAQEIEAWDTYTRGTGVKHRALPRSHRRPSDHFLRRVLIACMMLAVTASGLNASTVSRDTKPHPTWVAAPQNLSELFVTAPPIKDTNPGALDGQRGSQRAGRDAAKRVPPPPPPVPPIEKVIAYALAQQGKPYRWAQAGPGGFDCSGLVLAAFKQIGIKLPHYTGTMIGYGKKISKAQMQRGDIVFPSSGHVAIYLGGGQMVAASSGKHRVVVQPVYAFYAARRLV